MSDLVEFPCIVYGLGNTGYGIISCAEDFPKTAKTAFKEFVREVSWRPAKLNKSDEAVFALIPAENCAIACRLTDTGRDPYGRTLSLKVEGILCSLKHDVWKAFMHADMWPGDSVKTQYSVNRSTLNDATNNAEIAWVPEGAKPIILSHNNLINAPASWFQLERGEKQCGDEFVAVRRRADNDGCDYHNYKKKSKVNHMKLVNLIVVLLFIVTISANEYFRMNPLRAEANNLSKKSKDLNSEIQGLEKRVGDSEKELTDWKNLCAKWGLQGCTPARMEKYVENELGAKKKEIERLNERLTNEITLSDKKLEKELKDALKNEKGENRKLVEVLNELKELYEQGIKTINQHLKE